LKESAGSIPAASTFLVRLYGWLAASSIGVARMSHAGTAKFNFAIVM
jgi:hypothetical protein